MAQRLLSDERVDPSEAGDSLRARVSPDERGPFGALKQRETGFAGRRLGAVL